ncbi:hypothetical protein H8S90_24075 [Olivibacter sp. SDN3]|uniref:hypothetical protein n=1 Tax=Olivibacter sp. SDN3 TaxID=2764720 RepID=UPI001651A461|nr:hypothetical protein [Olivibacter sp. SDN3]QNL49749.1 hypothetical protein H8S90_24075 [Olivibacter sp. SDN3]
MHNWLQHYEYRTAVGWQVFVVAGAAALLITILTVSFQTVKTSLANPVDSVYGMNSERGFRGISE